MEQILNYSLTLVLLYGYPIIIGATFLAYLGLPISLNILIMAAGAFTSDGTLNVYILLPLVAISAFLGDVFGYYLGHRFGFLIINSYTKKIGITEKRLDSVEAFLERWGASFIFLTRWLFTPLGIPVNIMAGINRYKFKSFFLWALVGEIIWASLYIGLGRYFGANWVTLTEYVSDAPTFITLLTVGGILVWLGVKLWKKSHSSK